ncbi:MAG: hypothetical protein HOE69_08385 [Euryarchaeota archaeon]|nr:hypothetical protein [Euryarchaeota archaeon]
MIPAASSIAVSSGQGSLPMVYCPSCSEQQEDVTKFCRFCGDTLPGQETMIKLRNEALALASQRSGKHLSEAQAETAKTIAAIQQNGDNGGTNKPVNNGVHRQASQQATHNLKDLMRDF